MRIRDWSSDVCSSDLLARRSVHQKAAARGPRDERIAPVDEQLPAEPEAARGEEPAPLERPDIFRRKQIGRASCRAIVGQYVSISEVAVSLKKNTQQSSLQRVTTHTLTNF